MKGDKPAQEVKITPLPADDRRMAMGKAIYDDRCGACHLTNGSGIPALFPRLAQAPLIQSSNPTSLIRVVLMGSRGGATPSAPTAPAMPAFAWNFADEDVANVLTFVRNSWGNAAAPVEPGDVRSLRNSLRKEAATMEQ